jgi:hypothetical protein
MNKKREKKEVKVMSSSGKFSFIIDSSLVTFCSAFSMKTKKRQQWATSFHSNQVPLDSSALYDSKRTHCHSIFTSLAVQLKRLNTQLRSTQLLNDVLMKKFLCRSFFFLTDSPIFYCGFSFQSNIRRIVIKSLFTYKHFI